MILALNNVHRVGADITVLRECEVDYDSDDPRKIAEVLIRKVPDDQQVSGLKLKSPAFLRFTRSSLSFKDVLCLILCSIAFSKYNFASSLSLFYLVFFFFCLVFWY